MISTSDSEKISQIITEKLGLHFPENRWNDVMNDLLSSSRELGFEEDPGAFVEWFSHKKFSKKQLNIIAEQLTVGETYFFREKSILQVFRTIVIPGLIQQRNNTTRAIRIWSAGCSSGEEPYTLAMILSEALPDIATWHISILATDVNDLFLNKAKRGIYTDWSFRETPAYYQNKYFRKAGKEWEISTSIRKMVTFNQLNLAEGDFPSDHTNTRQIDLLFCRNVLMYFSLDSAKKVVEKFYHALQPGGWLFTSQVELSNDLFPMLETICHEGVFLYRKPCNTPLKRTASVKIPETTSKQKVHPHIPIQSSSSTRSPSETHAREARLLEEARTLANEGKSEEALERARAIFACDSNQVSAFYLAGLILTEMAQLDEAQSMFHRALYLDPRHLLSHFQLITLSRKQGDEKKTIKYTRNVNALIKHYTDDEELPDGNGMTLKDFRHLFINQTG